jgi:hypothetical protein
MRNSLLALVGVVAISGLSFSLSSGSASPAGTAEEGPKGTSLAERMGQLQRFTHKLVLAMRAGNAEATAFYIHELEESSSLIQAEFETYDGHAVRSLMAAMLDPAIERIEDNAATADELIGTLIESCNACHVATGHGFIRIVERRENPYLQEF